MQFKLKGNQYQLAWSIMVSQPSPPSCERNHLRKCSHFCLATWGLRFGIVVRISFVIRTFGNLLCLSQQLLRFLLHSDSVVKIHGGRSLPISRGHLEPLQRTKHEFQVEASWKYPKNPRKTSNPKNGGYNPSKESQHRNKKKS